MLKALFKKQFLELNTFYFQNKKTGKLRTRGGTIGMIVLFAVLLLYLAGVFFFISTMLAGAFIPAGLSWLYFSILSIIALLLGTFGSVFNTYSALYRAKDNEFLLSMPIPPSRIIFVRMTGVFAMGLLYEGVVFIPAVLAFWICGGVTGVLSVVNPILMFFVLGLLILVLTCLLGWLVALISSKLKNKSILTVLLAVVFFIGYYYVCLNAYDLLEGLAAQGDVLSVAFHDKAYPLYLLGDAAAGTALSMLIVSAAILLLTALTVYVLSRSFIRIATVQRSAGKATCKRGAMRENSLSKALFLREWKHFLSSATYMLNCAIGAFFMPVVAILAIVLLPDRLPDLFAALEEMGVPNGILTLVLFILVFFLGSMCIITAPSISLEGKNIAILQSMPVPAKMILRAKQKLHFAVALPFTLFLTVTLGILLRIGGVETILLSLVSVLSIALYSAAGLALNLKNPTLNWTNETVPVKQSTSVMICILGGWGVGLLLAVGGGVCTLALSMPVWAFLLLAAILLALPVYFINRWIDTRGAEIFATL